MDNFIENCTGVILAGGENKRMPVLKGFIEVEGKRIIERNLETMKQLFHEVFIVTNQPELYSYLGVSLLGDIYNIRGPMTGIFTALLNSSTPWIFVSACDMPFLNAELIRAMASFLKYKANRYSIVVPAYHKHAEPLFAFYSKSILTSLEHLILTGNKSINDFLLNCEKSVKYITKAEVKHIENDARSFINLNTPEDVSLYLQPEDRLKFKKGLIRRKKCSDLEQQN